MRGPTDILTQPVACIGALIIMYWNESLSHDCAEQGVAWEGFDGAENIEEITDHFVRWADLTVPQWLGHKHDWVMSLQVDYLSGICSSPRSSQSSNDLY